MIIGFLYVSVFTYTMDPNIENNSFIIVYISTVLLGFGWALINVNSYPMMVEMASGKNIGKFTGYYYSASMLAQSITPILVGIIMTNSNIGLKALYVYACVFMVLALFTFTFIKENRTACLKNSQSESKSFFELMDNDK